MSLAIENPLACNQMLFEIRQGMDRSVPTAQPIPFSWSLRKTSSREYFWQKDGK
jgi:hypothetical protein